MSQKHIKTVHSKEAGFMGLGGMGSLLFYLVMLAGAALLVVQLFSTSKLAKTEQAVASMRIAIKHLYLCQRTYGPNDANITKIIVDAGIAPKGFEYDAERDVLISPWNTDITVKSKEDGELFSITVKTPKDYCMRLATYDLISWYKVTVNGYSITNTPDSVGAVAENWGTALKDSHINVSFFSE